MVQWTEKMWPCGDVLYIVLFKANFLLCITKLPSLKLIAEKKKKKRKQFVLGPFDLYWLVKTICFSLEGGGKVFLVTVTNLGSTHFQFEKTRTT
ncbi:hypothetical protein VIGAN_01150700 [Vigna angularis var. angularis]|uniref:Uncharacterized protein n=1 Tax=Vigna angularis var. angularis TaxID=157739 RepID=A0A0S3R030_PHAAN|nr:hypothetical protein VIGAN_01150700 [Vigna angularis var. angularis]